MEQDLGNDYLAQRAMAARQDADPDAWFDRFSEAEAPAGGVVEDPAAPSAPMAKPADPTRAWLDTWLTPLAGAMVLRQRVTDFGDKVAGDIGRGVIEAPGAVVRGAAGAVENVFKTGDELATWLNDNVADLTIPVPDWVPDWVNNPARSLGDAGAAVKGGLFDERQSNTGKLVEFAAQWLTASAMTGRIAGALGMPANGFTKVIREFAAGALGFDPAQPRLANAIDDLAPNPVTDFLKADAEDPALVGRLKAGLETAGLGLVADGVIKSLRVIREAGAARTAFAAGDDAAAAAAAPAPAAAGAGKLVVEVANENAVQLSDDLLPKAAAFLKGEIPDAPVKVNLARFEGPEQIRQAIGDLAKLLPEDQVIPQAATLDAARQMGMTPADLLKGMEGGIFDRRQIAAGWMMFRSAAGELVHLAEKARATGAPVDVARFNAGFQTAYGILSTVKGQSSEIARALQIHNAIRKAEPDMVKQLQGMIDGAGGSQVALDMAEKIALLGDPAKAAQFVSEAGKASTRDQIVYAWSNILLSNPASHVANVADTTISTLLQVPETWFASKLGSGVAGGEATARLYGIMQGMRDGVRAAARTAKSGESQFAVGTRVEGLANPLATGQDLVKGGALRQAGDYLAMLIPTRVMQAGDELTKVMNYRAEIHAQAWRDAVVRQGLEGPAAKAHAAKLIAEMPEWLQKAGQDQAIKGTFNEPLQGMAADLARAVDAANVGGVPVGRILMPFVRTPTNLLRWTAHRTPVALLSPKIQAEIAAGGANRDLALGRIAAGSTVAAAIADLAAQGRITGAGPKDPELRAALMRTGWQPYSFKVGDSWYAYGRSGTLGSIIGVAADGAELVSGLYSKQPNRIDLDGEAVEDSTAAAVVLPFANALTNKTYMQGLAQLVDALADPNRRGDAWFQKLAGSIVPAGVAALERTIDPDIRRAEGALEAIRARVYGEGMAPRLNLWGEPLKDENGIYNLFLPVRQSAAKGTAIDAELVRLQAEIPLPGQVLQSGKGGASVAVKLSPELHNRLIALAGNELKQKTPAGELGARDLLDAIVTGQAGRLSAEYGQASDEKRELIIRDVITSYRSAARAKLLNENASLRGLIESELAEEVKAIKTPRGGPGGSIRMPMQ